jgi:hypothetical protein
MRSRDYPDLHPRNGLRPGVLDRADAQAAGAGGLRAAGTWLDMPMPGRRESRRPGIALKVSRGRYVLIWFTKLPPAGPGQFAAQIFTVVVRGSYPGLTIRSRPVREARGGCGSAIVSSSCS